MENPTVCPHCDREITSDDLVNYPKKLRERKIRNDFANSKICRRHNRVFVAGLILGWFAVVYPLISMSSPELNFFKLSSLALLILEIIFGVLTIAWTIHNTVKLPKLENKYVASRLAENNVSSK